MKHAFLILTFLLTLTATGLASTIYVTPEGTAQATGTAWADATSLHRALALATNGDEVWVRNGTYLTSAQGDRSATFTVPAGVRLYGGFVGTEISLTQRPAGSRTVLSGNIGAPTSAADNAYTVVTLESHYAASSLLDGFTIREGNARNYREGLSRSNTGGALFIQAAPGGTSTHQIVNCSFLNNQAHNGGAVYVDSGRPSFESCTFANNSADFNGGAVYNQGAGSLASPIFRACYFTDNNSEYGAGMINNGVNGNSSPLLIDCNFDNNISFVDGSAIYNLTDGSGVCEVIIENCKFTGNDSILGDDVSGTGISGTRSDRARRNSGGTLRPVSAKR